MRAPYIDFWRDHGPAYNETGKGSSQCIGVSYLTDECRFGTYQYTAEAERIIANHDTATPLFIYLAYGATHGPLQAPQKFLDMYPHIDYEPRKKCLAMISIVDESIANVTAALKGKGMWNSTLVIFSRYLCVYMCLCTCACMVG